MLESYLSHFFHYGNSLPAFVTENAGFDVSNQGENQRNTDQVKSELTLENRDQDALM